MTDFFEYKGYLGSAEIDVESRALVGKLAFIRDTITYSADSVEKLEVAFREAVDDYLSTCARLGDEPDVPCKGSFNVRVGPDRHRAIVIAARTKGVGLNDYVCAALDAAVRPAHAVNHRHEVFVYSLVTKGEPMRLMAGPQLAIDWMKPNEIPA